MEERIVCKAEREYEADGWTLYASNDSDEQIIEWEDPCACRLALDLHQMLRRHALNTTFVQKFQGRGLVVRRLEYLPFSVVVKATAHDSAVSFVDTHGAPMDKKALEETPGAKANRIAMMEDVGLHVARSLRAYLGHLGIHELSLRLHFGMAPDGACSLQVPNPLECSFGTTDYEALCNQLAGKK